MDLTASQLSSIRSRPQRTRLWLGIYQPQTVFSAQINQAGISKGAREITITALSGNSFNVVRGMTCYIGTLAGGRDIGRIRVIYATDSLITIAENSYSWVDGWFLTVAKYHEPWTVFPRIVLDDDNIATHYRDYDILYTDQNQYMQPVINMGPHYAGFLDAFSSGTYEQVWYTSSGTFDPTVDGGVASYDWAFEGGMPTGSTDADPGWVEYTGSGYYLTRLRAVTDDGKTGTAFRHIMILDRPGGSGANEPVKAWGFRGFDGDRESGGYTVGIWIREAAGLTTITEGSLIVIFSDDWEGNDPVTKISANAENRGQILYSGYVLEDTTYWNPITSRLEFETASITGRMDELATFAHVTKSAVNAMTWTELRDQTVDRATISFLRWHSTVLEVHDFAQTGDTKGLKWTDYERGSLYESINNFLMNALLARMVSDRQGKMWAEVDARVTPTGSDRQANNYMQEVLNMSNADWRGEISIPRRFESELAYLEMGGLNYSGPSETGGIAAFLAGAPGEAPDYFGSVERVQGLVVSNQLQLNELVGYAFSMKNSVYPEVDVPIAGDYRFLDIAPQHRVLVTVAENDTHRGIVWTQKPFIPQEISYQWLPQFQSLLMDIGLAEETGGEPGFGPAATIEIPLEPPYDEWDLPDWEIELPPIIPPDPWFPPTEPPPGDGNLVYTVGGGHIGRTRNFWDASPNWESVSIAGTTGTIYGMRLDPHNPKNGAMLLTLVGGSLPSRGPRVFRTNNLNAATPTWTEVWGVAENQAWPGSGNQTTLFDIQPKGNQAGFWAVTGYDRVLGSDHKCWPWITLDYGGSWAGRTNGIEAGNPRAQSIIASAFDDVMWVENGAGTMWRSFNSGISWIERTNLVGNPNGGRIYQLHELPMSQYVLLAGTTDGIFVTTNGGTTWNDIAPVFQGKKWYLEQGPASQQLNDRFVSHPQNGNWYAALLKTGTAVMGFWHRASIGGNWVMRHQFIGRVNGQVGYNPSNPAQFYARGSGDDFDIMGSEDGGYTWLNKEGDYEAEVSAGFNFYGMEVVWGA